MDKRISRLLLGVCLLLYFLSLAGDGLWVRFAADDPVNMAAYHSAGLARAVQDNLLFFNGACRPLGGLWCLPVHNLAHLDPLSSDMAASLAVLLSCFHVNLLALYYYNSFVFDILCFTAYYGALICYIAGGRAVVFLLLNIATLNAMEMAVTLPLVRGAYELLAKDRPRCTGCSRRPR